MTDAKYVVGQDVFVCRPQAFVADAASITGIIQAVERGRDRWIYRIRAYVAKFGGGYWIDLAYGEGDIGLRLGTPLSQLSGRPGFPGYERFKAIASSYGYD